MNITPLLDWPQQKRYEVGKTFAAGVELLLKCNTLYSQLLEFFNEPLRMNQKSFKALHRMHRWEVLQQTK